MPFLEETYDVAVVGAGHAGCEAALACARLGLETIMFTVDVYKRQRLLFAPTTKVSKVHLGFRFAFCKASELTS